MSDDWRTEFFTLIEDCRKRDDRISSWEANFLDSIDDRLTDNKELTPKQVETLDNIWNKATAKG